MSLEKWRERHPALQPCAFSLSSNPSHRCTRGLGHGFNGWATRAPTCLNWWMQKITWIRKVYFVSTSHQMCIGWSIIYCMQTTAEKQRISIGIVLGIMGGFTKLERKSRFQKFRFHINCEFFHTFQIPQCIWQFHLHCSSISEHNKPGFWQMM